MITLPGTKKASICAVEIIAHLSKCFKTTPEELNILPCLFDDDQLKTQINNNINKGCSDPGSTLQQLLQYIYHNM